MPNDPEFFNAGHERSITMVSMNASSLSSAWADRLFSKLDTSNQGYIDKSGLESAFSKISGESSTENADDLFTKLDTDADGKVTKDEMTSVLKSLFESTSGKNASGMASGGPQGPGGPGGAPPPPPAENDSGFTEDELTQQLDEMGSSDSQRSDLISKIVNNFDEADTDGDGKVTAMEAMAYDQANQTAESSAMPVGGPPPAANDSGFTEDELTQQLEEIGSSDSQRSDLISKIVNNFDEADSDSDGKVSFKEARTFDEANQTSESADASSSSTSASQQADDQTIKEIMKLMQAYEIFGAGLDASQSSKSSISDWA
jgi:Ca2+-binding EF-hand superfamily protein